MALESVISLTSICIPNLSLFVEGPSDNFISEGIVKSHGVHDIIVFVKTQEFFTSVGVPHLASSVVRSSNKFISTLVEGAVGKREQMGAQYFEKSELLLLIFKLLVNEFLNKTFELRSLRF